MSQEDVIDLAKQIYAYRIVFNPDWDKQKIARECIEAAMQFSLVLEQEGFSYSTPVAPPFRGGPYSSDV